MQPDSPDAILHLATLHLLSQAGFASTSRAASLSLSSVAAQYFRVVAQACVDRAVLAGRSKVAAQDVLGALQDMGVAGDGYGMDELMEYGLDHAGVGFKSSGIDDLSDYLREGLSTHDPVAELKVYRDEDLPLADSGSSSDEDSEDDEAMEVDQKPDLHLFRSDSPDFSWLPPIPGSIDQSKVAPGPIRRPSTTTAAVTVAELELAQSAPVSITDRYRTRIPFASSSLATRPSPYLDPPRAPEKHFTPQTSSLQSLIQTYASTKSEPSLTLRQTDTRRQAFELLRRQIAPPDKYSPSASLSLPNIPAAPRTSPIVPSFTTNETIQPAFVPINPDPSSSLLSQLVHSIQSPHLPPDLRERLTSLRPPLPQKRDTGQGTSEPILYGPPSRGPDTAALLRAKGKTWNPEDEAYMFATWDAGPKGIKKWGRGELPSGKKVIKHVKGEEVPRRPEGYKPPVEAKRTVKLSLSRGNTSLGPSIVGGVVDSPGHSPSVTPSSTVIALPALPVSPGIESISSVPEPNQGTPASSATNSNLTVPRPAIRLTLSPTPAPVPGSLSPAPPTPGGGPTLKLKLGVRANPSPGPASPAQPNGGLPQPAVPTGDIEMGRTEPSGVELAASGQQSQSMPYEGAHTGQPSSELQVAPVYKGAGLQADTAMEQD